MTVLSWILFAGCLVPLGYLYVLALASVRGAMGTGTVTAMQPTTRFIIAIPAHDEASVIGATVRRLRELDYPRDLFSVHVVADHCSDDTARLAREAGANVHERRQDPRSGKGAALAWLFERVLDAECDAVVVFDSDTRVDREFLRIMNSRLVAGESVVQGQHVISNPEEGWFPALTWAMFLVDNRFQNLGRARLGWSAKHMGDSICFRASVLREFGWGDGLTEDFQLRQRLLLGGVRIAYEPAARGYGEAPPSWEQAETQRARWLRGTHDASRQSARRLVAEGVRRRDAALIDGALQAYLPSFSTLTIVSAALLVIQLLVNWWAGPVFGPGVVVAWAALIGLLFAYPLLGLKLERAPAKAYLAMLLGPFFILWRSRLALTSRYGRSQVRWIRTVHGGKA